MAKAKKSIELPQWCLSRFEESFSSESLRSDIRQQAFEQLMRDGLPGPRDEEWKYTNLTPVLNLAFAKAGAEIELPDLQVLEELSSENFSRLVFVDGTFQPGLSLTPPQGVEVQVIDPAQFEAPEGKLHALNALNLSLAESGIEIEVAEGQEIEKPLHILHLLSAQQLSCSLHPRVQVKLGRGAKLSLLESVHSLDEGLALFNPVTTFQLEKGSSCEFLRTNELNKDSYQLSLIDAEVKEEAHFAAMQIGRGSKLSRQEGIVRLPEENAFAALYGLSMLDGHQHIDNSTLIHHIAPNCESDELFKGVYDDHSRGVFSGTIIVEQDAQKTNAIQNNSALLLSRDASIDTRPQLKIWADDVRCTHGATVGELDDEALFYLRSRGVPLQQAQKLLMRAYIGEVEEKLVNESLRSFLHERIDE